MVVKRPEIGVCTPNFGHVFSNLAHSLAWGKVWFLSSVHWPLCEHSGEEENAKSAESESKCTLWSQPRCGPKCVKFWRKVLYIAVYANTLTSSVICHLSATELFWLLHLVCGTICLAKLHLLSHCKHSGDISKHSRFSDLFQTSSWHSSGPSSSSFLLRPL